MSFLDGSERNDERVGAREAISKQSGEAHLNQNELDHIESIRATTQVSRAFPAVIWRLNDMLEES